MLTAVGVPEISPLLVLSVRPEGSPPLMMENVYGASPAVSTRSDEYGVPTMPVFAGQESVICSSLQTGSVLIVVLLPQEAMLIEPPEMNSLVCVPPMIEILRSGARKMPAGLAGLV